MNPLFKFLIILPLLLPSSVLNTRSSLVRLTNPNHDFCTGFVIKKNIVLTDDHCMLSGTMMVDGKEAVLLRGDPIHDLAVLQTETDKPALTIKEKDLDVGESVWGIGYGYAWENPIVKEQKVLLNSQSPNGMVPPGLMTAGGYHPGQSGGPVVDKHGDVVGIIQQSADGLGYAAKASDIKTFLHEAGVE